MKHWFKFTFAEDYLVKKSVRSKSSRLFQIVEALYKKDF
jgi:hypothetical protein